MKSLLVLLILWSTVARAETCAQAFRAGADQTQDYLSYLEKLLEQRTLTLAEVEGLILAPRANPLMGATELAARIHASEFEAYLSNASLDTERVAQWARAKLEASSQAQSERREVERSLRRVGEMHFVRFVTDPKTNTAIEVMDTLVTQRMWREIMGTNPSHFRGNKESQLDHPVEMVNWYSATMFANELSRRAGFKNYYVSQHVRMGGNALSGTYQPTESISRRAQFSKILPEDSDGYRLPTHREMVLLREIARPVSKETLDQSAWLESNSRGSTQPVAELLPLAAQGAEIYDLFGNVWEWSDDWVAQTVSGPQVHARGGGYRSDLDEHHIDQDFLFRVDQPHKDVGFRLVRTLK